MARSHPGSPPTLMEEAASIVRRASRRLRERRCRALTRPEPIDGQRTLVTMLEATPILVDPTDLGLSRTLARDGYWEIWLTEAIEAIVRPGMTVIDIGANLGYFSLLMAERVGPRGHVHAFEPNPEMADRASESAGRAGVADRISFHRDPLWDVDGEPSVLKVPGGEPKNAHLVTHAGDETPGIRLISRRLDSYEALLDADVIKIDVEGAEERIWRGMAGLFARGRALTVFLEFTPNRYEAPMAFLEEIMAQGFILGELSVSYGIRPVTPGQILDGTPDEDRMLALRRGTQR